MGQKTKIDWCDATFNPVTGCAHGCKYCYARRIAERFGDFDVMNPENAPFEKWYSIDRNSDDDPYLFEVNAPLTRITKNGDVATAPYPFGFSPTFHNYRLDEPQKWKEPKDIFVCSMADLFADYIPDEWIDSVFDACMEAPQHRYFFLTKNPKRYIDLFDKMDKAGVAEDFVKNHKNW